jgi:hypothetical protein
MQEFQLYMYEPNHFLGIFQDGVFVHLETTTHDPQF